MLPTLLEIVPPRLLLLCLLTHDREVFSGSLGVQARSRLTHISVGMNNEVLRVPQSGGDAVYELCAVSLHSGLTDTSGHFITLLKRGDQWWYIDDLKDPATCIHVFRVFCLRSPRQTPCRIRDFLYPGL